MEEQNNIIINNEKNNENENDNKIEVINLIEAKRNEIILEEKPIQNLKKEENKLDKIDIIIKQLKEQDEIIKKLQNKVIELKKINEENNIKIDNLKEQHNSEIKNLKEDFKKEIIEIKEEIIKKDDLNIYAKKRELQYLKENLDNLYNKYNEFERVTESKMEFIESNITKILEKEDNNLKENKYEKKDNVNNNISLDENKADNKEINNLILFEDNNIPFDKKYSDIIYKDFKKILSEIFSLKNLKVKEIDKKHFDKLKKYETNLFKNKYFPIEYCSDFIIDSKEKMKDKISKEVNNNLNYKKNVIFAELNLISDMNNKNDLIKDNKTKIVDIKNFDINTFRNEFNLSKEDFPDQLLNKLYMECGGSRNKMFTKLIIK